MREAGREKWCEEAAAKFKPGCEEHTGCWNMAAYLSCPMAGRTLMSPSTHAKTQAFYPSDTGYSTEGYNQSEWQLWYRSFEVSWPNELVLHLFAGGGSSCLAGYSPPRRKGSVAPSGSVLSPSQTSKIWAMKIHS